MKIGASLLLLFSTLIYSSNGYSQTADPNAIQSAKCILQYINSLPSNPNNKVISGQWMNNMGLPETPMTEFDTAITALYNQSNKWAGIIGTNYTRTHTLPFYIAIENMYMVNQPLINHFNNNGFIAIMTNFKNPWNQTNSNDLNNSTNLLDVVTPSHPANINFNKELDSLAKGFSQLQDSGVVVLFRPFHEMNGNWFWWGSKTSSLPISSDCIALWQYVFNYLTVTKNLHNILWVYAAATKESNISNPAFKSEMFYYPGNTYVDIIGLDVYNDTLDIPNYLSILAANKPIGLAEFGPRKATVLNIPLTYDYMILLNQIKNKYPALCYCISWNHHVNNTNDWVYYSMVKQNNTINMLNDRWVINQDEIDYSSCLPISIEEESLVQSSTVVYPNPSVDHITINSNFELSNAEVTLTNLLGHKVIELMAISAREIKIPTSNWIKEYTFYA